MKNLARKFVVGWLINVLALYLAAYFIPGVSYSKDVVVLIVAALIFGLANWLLKPIIKILSIPLFFLKGVLIIFINCVLLWFVFQIVPGFQIGSIFALICAGILVSLINSIFHLIL